MTEKAYAESLDIFRLRYKYGTISQLQLSQTESLNETARTVVPNLEALVRVQENQLAVLTGQLPGAIPRGQEIDQLTAPAIPAGLPSTLLERRPGARGKTLMISHLADLTAQGVDQKPENWASSSQSSPSFFFATFGSDWPTNRNRAIITIMRSCCQYLLPLSRKEVQMSRTQLNMTVGLSLLSLVFTPALLPAADSAVVVPFFSSQKTVATGSAIKGTSTDGIGLYGFSSTGYAVRGEQEGTLPARGYGGYFTSSTGIGLYGGSTATPFYSNAYTQGVYGFSEHGYGVLGTTGDSGKAGVYGIAPSTATGSAGVYGVAKGPSGYGVRGYASGSAGYGGYFSSSSYRGLYAGTYSSSDYAAYIYNSSGSSQPGIYVRGTIVASGSKAGYVVDIAVNDGPETLETGDLVVVTGHGEPVAGEIPLIRVRKSTTAASSAIVGVVDQPFTVPPPELAEADLDISGLEADTKRSIQPLPGPAASSASLTDGTGIAPGEYLSVVTLGSFKAIKADATGGPIRPGSLLVSSPEPGHAMAADNPGCGTVIGKALGGLDSGTGLIPVMVTLH
ncbi:MAG TPA: hypothetical protein DDY20_10380 [Desulfobulbaceae bacterium]|nr:hypothetical protein [Desulfobulbaceae bacterium]